MENISASWLIWDPSPIAFTIPFFDYPVFWYGIFFAVGFLFGYFFLLQQLKRNYPLATALFLADRLVWTLVLGTVIGARLGVVVFYEWGYFSSHPMEIFQVWRGGLASHGGVIGILVALLLYHRSVKKQGIVVSFWQITDWVVLPAIFTGGLIRLGNWMNQEILGLPSPLPWAVILGHPADGSLPVPRHPVQLYEAAAYLSIFVSLWWVEKKLQWKKLCPGRLTALFFLCIFTARIALEFWKVPQGGWSRDGFFQTGQWLSLPFVVWGAWLFWKSGRSHACRWQE